MNKVTVVAIAVLFLLVGFGYASAQQLINMAGPLTSLRLNVTYEEELPPTTILLEGQEFITVVPPIGKLLSASESALVGYKYQFDPMLYEWFDTNGNLSQINITWLDPNPNSSTYGLKIWTMSCTGGNQSAPIPDKGPSGMSEIQDGSISTKPRETSQATTRTDSVEGVLACYICPDGFVYSLVGTTSTPTLANTVCNGGESYINGYLTFRGTNHWNLTTNTVTSSITGTVAGGSFDYVGETWASKDCTIYSSAFECRANFTGTFGATTLKACKSDDPYCWSGL